MSGHTDSDVGEEGVTRIYVKEIGISFTKRYEGVRSRKGT